MAQAVEVQSESLSAPEHDELAEQFFSQPPPQAWEVAFDDWQPQPQSVAERRAMMATFVLLTFGAMAAVALGVFPDSIMVSPAPLAAAGARPLVALSQLALTQPDLQHGLTALAKAAPNAIAHAPNAPAPAIVAPAIVAPAIVAPAVVAPAIVAPAIVAPAVVAPAIVAPAVVAPAVVARAVSDRQEPRSRASAAIGNKGGALAHADRSPAALLIAQARHALDTGRAVQARELAERAVRLEPTQAAGYIVLAGAYDALGDRAAMKTAFRRCSALAQDGLVSACMSLAR